MKSDLGIVIVNWNCKEEILQCLESIKEAGYISDVIVVDNDSSDDSVAQIRKSFAEVKIRQMRKNLGYGGGNNEGIKYFLKKGAKYILILNPDTLIVNDTIDNLVKAMEQDKSIGIVGPKIYSEDVSLRRIWSCGGVLDEKRYSGGLVGLGEKDLGQYDKVREVDFISGTAMMVRREVFEKIGLFESLYFLYYEDVEFCLKAKKAGFKVLFVPSAIIYHKESTSMKKNSPAHDYYMARNHLLFVERNAPFMIKLRELIRLPKTVYEHWQKGERWAIRGIGDYFMRRFNKHDYWS